MIVVEHVQAEVALRRGTSESENAACFTMSSTIGGDTVIAGRTGCLWRLEGVKASKQALILT